MSQLMQPRKLEIGSIIKTKRIEIVANSYQKGWELAFDLMESYFSKSISTPMSHFDKN